MGPLKNSLFVTFFIQAPLLLCCSPVPLPNGHVTQLMRPLSNTHCRKRGNFTWDEEHTHTQRIKEKALFCELYFLLRKFGVNGIGYKKWQENTKHHLPHECNNSRAHTWLIAQLVKNRLQCGRPGFHPWVGKLPRRRDRLPTPVFLVFPCGSAGKESTCNAKTWVRSLGWEDPLEKGKSTPQYSCLENSMDWGHKESDMTEWLSLHMHHILAGNH